MVFFYWLLCIDIREKTNLFCFRLLLGVLENVEQLKEVLALLVIGNSADRGLLIQLLIDETNNFFEEFL